MGNQLGIALPNAGPFAAKNYCTTIFILILLNCTLNKLNSSEAVDRVFLSIQTKTTRALVGQVSEVCWYNYGPFSLLTLVKF